MLSAIIFYLGYSRSYLIPLFIRMEPIIWFTHHLIHFCLLLLRYYHIYFILCNLLPCLLREFPSYRQVLTASCFGHFRPYMNSVVIYVNRVFCPTFSSEASACAINDLVEYLYWLAFFDLMQDENGQLQIVDDVSSLAFFPFYFLG